MYCLCISLSHFVGGSTLRRTVRIKLLFYLFWLQVVKVMVLKCEPQQERLLLSFRLSSKPAPEDKKECTPKKKKEVKYQIGEVLNSMTSSFFLPFPMCFPNDLVLL